MGFKEQYSNTERGPARDQLVYRELLTQGKPTDLWPMTVDGPNGSKVTYYITRDFLHVGDVYPSMTATTAQKIADAFGMHLPSNTIADQVWKAAKGKINVAPLSGTGYQGRDKFYSPQEVVNSRIGATDANVAFSQKIQEALSKNPNAKKELIDIGQGAKWITMPPASNSLGLHGIRRSDDPKDLAQSGYGTAHPHYEDHSEYGSLVRLVDDRVTVTPANGQPKTMTMNEFAKTPEHTALFVDGQDIRNGGMARYDVKRDKAQLAKIDKEVGVKGNETQVAQNGTEQVDKFLGQLSNSLTANITDRLIKKYADVTTVTEPAPPETEEQKPANNSKGRMSMLQRIDDFLNGLKSGL